MHPEDRKMKEEGEIYARAHAAEFVAEFSGEMLKLIATYGDGDAENLLGLLRERFWARVWRPKEQK